MTTKANIIIIEDEKNICSFIEHILEPQGYRVISANTGKEGLQYSLWNGTPDWSCVLPSVSAIRKTTTG